MLRQPSCILRSAAAPWVVAPPGNFLTIMKTTVWLAGWVIVGGVPTGAAMPLTESTFTEIIHEANVISTSNKAGAPARTQEVFRMPDLVRTGRDSRVELTAKDQTITRVGANTTFTFAPGGRDVELKQGGVLFHAPAGVGGGAIKYRGTSAAVLGTTELAEVLADGRFKVLDLEGSVKVTLQNGLFVTLKPGQMVIVSADGKSKSELMDFNLGQLASRLLEVVGFARRLASASLIEAAIRMQNQQIAAGDLTHLVSLQEAGVGLDLTTRAMNGTGLTAGWVLTNSADQPAPDSNPLDFPGEGPIGPFGYPFITPAPLYTTPPVIHPPAITEPTGPVR